MPVEIANPAIHVEERGTAHPIAGVPTSTTAFIGVAARGPVDVPTALSSFTDFERLFGGPASDLALGYAVRQFFDNGGRDAVIVRTDSPMPDGALGALERTTFNLLCLPPRQAGLDLAPATRGAAADLCRRRNALFIVDPSHAWARSSEAISGLDAYFPQRGAESALYFPLLRGADPLAGGTIRTFAPCGAIAGMMARTDSRRGVWKAPAGLEASLRGGLMPAIPLNDRDGEVLNPLGINALRTFPRVGTVAWGARTLARPDGGKNDEKYVPVRRLAAFIAQSVSRALEGVVFEPNVEATWNRVREAVDRFLHDLFRQGAMAGRTPREAYLVKCDAETTRAADIAAGRANLLVGFAPLRPAEFVMLRFALTMQG